MALIWGENSVLEILQRGKSTQHVSLPLLSNALTGVRQRPAVQPLSSATVVNQQQIHFLGMKATFLNSFTIQFYLLTNKFKILGSSCSSDLVLPCSLKLSLGEQHTFPSHTLALESPQPPCEVGTPPFLSLQFHVTDKGNRHIKQTSHVGDSGSAWSLNQRLLGLANCPGPTGFLLSPLVILISRNTELRTPLLDDVSTPVDSLFCPT